MLVTRVTTSRKVIHQHHRLTGELRRQNLNQKQFRLTLITKTISHSELVILMIMTQSLKEIQKGTVIMKKLVEVILTHMMKVAYKVTGYHIV